MKDNVFENQAFNENNKKLIKNMKTTFITKITPQTHHHSQKQMTF